MDFIDPIWLVYLIPAYLFIRMRALARALKLQAHYGLHSNEHTKALVRAKRKLDLNRLNTNGHRSAIHKARAVANKRLVLSTWAVLN